MEGEDWTVRESANGREALELARAAKPEVRRHGLESARPRALEPHMNPNRAPRRAFLLSVLSVVAVFAMGSLGCGPLVMIPGGQLDGTVKSAPPDWSFTDAHEVVQLETMPGSDPYSVNIWGVSMGPYFYVAGATKSGWVSRAASDPEVRLRVGEDVYELRAVQVDDEGEIDRLKVRYLEKYDHEIDDEQRATATVFRLEARS